MSPPSLQQSEDTAVRREAWMDMSRVKRSIAAILNVG